MLNKSENFTGFGLYDKSFIEVLRNLDDTTPFLRGIVAELGYKRKNVEYQQENRRAGKTHNNWYTLYDAAMLSVTAYTKVGLRMATFIGFFAGIISIVLAFVLFNIEVNILGRICCWYSTNFDAVLILGSLLLFFMGMLGEYILTINKRMMKRPLVIEEERINFNQIKE